MPPPRLSPQRPPTSPKNRPPSRCASPHFRPGLQEESDARVEQSPVRPRGHHRSHSHTPRHDDDDVEQPRHRKSVSDTPQFFSPGLEIPELNEKVSIEEAMSSDSPDIEVETVLTPPPVRFQAVPTPMVQYTPAGHIKTGKGKMRRKGSTPPIFTQPVFAAPSSTTNSGFGQSEGLRMSSSFADDQSMSSMPSIRTTASFPEQSTATAFQPQAPFAPTEALFHIGKPPGGKRAFKARKHVHAAATRTAMPAPVATAPPPPPPPPQMPTAMPPVAAAFQSTAPPPTAQFSSFAAPPVPAAFSPPLTTAKTPNRADLSPMDVEFEISRTPFAPGANLGGFQMGKPSTGRSNHRGPRGRTASWEKSKPFQTTSIFGSSSQDTDSTTLSTPPSREDEEATEKAAEQARIAALVSTLRDEARSFYVQGCYPASIDKYTSAIKLFESVAPTDTNDTLAVLYSNRAACLIMMGAYEAAASDCRLALPHVSEATTDAFSSDSGAMLKVKLLTRMAKAVLKQGEQESALELYDRAVKTAGEVEALIKARMAPTQSPELLSTLSQMTTEATVGQMDAKRLSDMMHNISECTLQNLREPGDRRNCSAALSHVNMALKIANGAVKLWQSKLAFLTSMKRWRDAASVCERLACSFVPFDSVFAEDLESKNPFLGIAPAAFLTADYFGNSGEDDDIKLNSRAAAEAVLRLPFCLTATYLRALRLEERYPAADAALRALEELVARGTPRQDAGTLRGQFLLLSSERVKLDRTKAIRERGDELFRVGDFDLAASQYGACLLIDSEGTSAEPGSAGGRLHAVLHCNRAACLMAVRRFHEAIEECTAALRIHSRYMKAMLRRSRCYVRLQRYQEAIAEYKRWLELVEEARASPNASAAFVTPCLFDGPKDVSDADIAQVKRELDEVYRSKRRADTAAREEANRRRERQAWQDNFSHSSWYGSSGSTSSAYQRKEEWYNRENDSRRWDSFGGSKPSGRGSASSTSGASSSGPSGARHNRSKSWGEQQYYSARPPAGSPGSDMSLDHYSVLGLQRNASDDDIKRKYRKLALQYHPDKNKSEGAADKFRRIKLAYETLSDTLARQKYDAERGYRRY